MRRALATVLAPAVVAGLLAGCGVKGDPELPPGVQDEFPRVYPKIERPWLEGQEQVPSVPSVLPPALGTPPHQEPAGTAP